MRHSSLRKSLHAGLAAFILASGCLWISGDLLAQKIGSSLGGFSSSSNQPIDIESDTLEVQDANKIAIFSGNVKAVQGKMIMRSKRLKVKYAGGENDAAAGANTAESKKKSGGSRITSIRAEGKVLINTADDQTVTSDWALFDVISQTVTIGGNVVLSQAGANFLRMKIA
ncbi:MAG: LptA/OstA family protein [Alphaproteobacteria bacterium]